MKWVTQLMPAFALVSLLTACAAISREGESLPAAHPEKLAQGRPLCSECHQDEGKVRFKEYASFDHTTGFVNGHRLAATTDAPLCAACHAASFCSDCHSKKTAMKPSLKLGNRPDRELPHRGEYLSLHRIDGKVDPASCYRCHGRGNNELCRTCHR